MSNYPESLHKQQPALVNAPFQQVASNDNSNPNNHLNPAEYAYNDAAYKKKCKSTQSQIKEMIFVNAVLQSRIKELKEKISIGKNQRKFLLNKLLTYEKDNQTQESKKVLNSSPSKKQSISKEIKIKTEPET